MVSGKAVVALALAGSAATSADAKVVQLKQSTWDAEVASSGKGVFVKFFAPWCGHCKALAPTWDKLGEAFGAEPSVTIADVDCTEEDSLCGKFGVGGYPTLKYFTPETGSEGKDYQGGRDEASLTKFVKENVMAKCSVKDQSDCTDKEKGFITKMQGKAKDEQEKELERLVKIAKGKMAADKKAWVSKRKSLVEQMLGKKPAEPEELDDLDDTDSDSDL